MKKKQTLEAGFSMIELIVVMGIMAILAGVAISSMSLLTAGNVKKCSAKFNSALNEAQVQTMSLKDPTYLYLYRDSNGKIMVATSTTKCDDRSDLDDSTIKLKTREVGDKSVTVKFKQGSTERTLANGQMLRIVYRKDSGAYDYESTDKSDDTKYVGSGHSGTDSLSTSDGTSKDFISEVQFTGKKGRYKVKMVKETGKHYVER